MPGLGTLVNVCAIVAGGLLGLLFGQFLPERLQNMMTMSCGIATVFIGAGGALSGMLTVSGDGFAVTGTMMMIASLVLGGLLGGLLRIEDRLESFGEWLKAKTGNAGDGSFVGAFVTASLTVCIGAMAIVGSIEDGINGNHAILFAKAVLDFVIILIMASSLGKGSVFSAVPVGILQGGVTLLSGMIAPLLTDAAMHNLSTVGSILIFCVGLNLMFGKKVRVGDMLPALIVAAVWPALPFGG